MVGREVKEQPHLFRVVQKNWEVWQQRQSWVLRNRGKLEELIATNAAGAYLAIPARYVIAAPLWLPKSDPVTIKKMAEVELDIRGLTSKAGVGIHVSYATENQLLVCGQIFPEPFPTLFCHSAFGYVNASPLFAQLEENAVHLWQEGLDIVVVFTREKEPVYWETIPFPSLNTELLSWMNCIYFSLKEADILPAELKFINYLKSELLTPHFCIISITTQLSAPPLSEKLPLCDWKSPSRRTMEIARRKRKNYVLVGSLGGGLYLLFIATLSMWAGLRYLEANRMRHKIEALEPEIRSLMEIQKQWVLLGTTIDSTGFPIEILHFIVKQIPAEGMWLTQFEFDNQKVTISGETESVSIAAQFFSGISKILPQMQWDMPPPSLLSNNRAKFVISGKS
ncbi:MAG: hypothetical protein C5B47_05840 [Verrucomicrobia bacterium]|nr:MAG: hypothetical protein C5B47_05840 [Verrucomicrobiota bacterium]